MKNSSPAEERLEIVVYDPSLPLARKPNERTSKLGFRDEEDRLEQLKKCQNGVTERCIEGARMGCSLKASKKCKVPWVLKLIGLKEEVWKKRDACESEYVKDCMDRTRIQCTTHAMEFCSLAFPDEF